MKIINKNEYKKLKKLVSDSQKVSWKNENWDDAIQNNYWGEWLEYVIDNKDFKKATIEIMNFLDLNKIIVLDKLFYALEEFIYLWDTKSHLIKY